MVLLAHLPKRLIHTFSLVSLQLVMQGQHIRVLCTDLLFYQVAAVLLTTGEGTCFEMMCAECMRLSILKAHC